MAVSYLVKKVSLKLIVYSSGDHLIKGSVMTNKDKVNIVIVGQGAIGLLWYRHLHQNCHNQVNTSLLSSKNSIRNKNFYTFTSFENIDEKVALLHTNDNILAKADFILICVKSYQIQTAIERIHLKIKKNSSIVLCHNGLGTIDKLKNTLLKSFDVYTLLITHGCKKVQNTSGEWHIKHTGVGHSDLGVIHRENVEDNSRDENTHDENKRLLTALLHQALPLVLFSEDIKTKQWLKLIINCVINPITALNNIENGEVNLPIFRHSTKKLLEEIISIAKQENLTFNLDELLNQVETVAKNTAKNSSSMRCDLLNKQRTEIDYINGYIHKLGLKHKIATPENTRMWQQITTLTDKV